MNELIQSFRPTATIKELRSNQVEAMNSVHVLLIKGHKFIELEAPPGSGKSLIAATLMNYFNNLGLSCLVTSPMNMQVDQYSKAGFGLVTLKGREHYACQAGKRNCSEGFCVTKLCPDGKTKRDCRDQPYKVCYSPKCKCNFCTYKMAFRIYKESSRCNTNFQLFLMGIRPKDLDVVIIDEADTIESSIRSFKSVVVPKLLSHFKFPEVISDLMSFIDECFLEIKGLKEKKTPLTVTEEKHITYLEELCSSILELTDDYNTYKEQWCITQKYGSGKTKFEPVTIFRFLTDLFHDRIIIMMSATPPHYSGFEKVRVSSIFPVASRQWIYDPFPGSMTKAQRDASIPRAAVWLSNLKGKSLIHSKSYETAEKLHRALQIIKKSSLIQVNKETDKNEIQRFSRYDAIDAFLRSRNPDEILISVNQTRGLDLWYPEVINNVILVNPWVNPTDPLAKLKTEILGESWKNQEMASEITQSIARHFRNEKMGIYKGIEVPKRAYIIDASFGNWYLKNKSLFPVNFTESQKL